MANARQRAPLSRPALSQPRLSQPRLAEARRREWAATLIPLVGGLLALVLATQSPVLAPGGWLPHPGIFLLLLAALLCLMERPFEGSNLGPSALVVALALHHFGTLPAACLVVLAQLGADLVRRVLRRRAPTVEPERRRMLRTLEDCGTLALAVVFGGSVAVAVPPFGPPPLGYVLPLAVAGLGAVFALVFLRLADKKLRRPLRPLPWADSLFPLLSDLLFWWVGVALALVLDSLGWGPTSLLLAGYLALCVEAGRRTLRHGISEQRVEDLERLSRASRRMAGGEGSELTVVAERLRAECAGVVNFQWFQFELLAQGVPYRSWAAGPDGQLEDGNPQPPDAPPPLPGIHRRTRWQVIERALESGQQLVGRLRLWCDPRRLEADGVSMLDSLLPQMLAVLERALLDREAKTDPLTGLALRRVLEARMAEAFDLTRRTGAPMAAILCDLDHFKSINDRFGHAFGDLALQSTAAVLHEIAGEQHLAARYGGEEFTLLLANADGVLALRVAEQVRQRVAAIELEHEGQAVPLTISLGVACYPEVHIHQPDDLLELADEALYRAKGAGRNLALLYLGPGRYRGIDGAVLEAEDSGGDPPSTGGGREGAGGDGRSSGSGGPEVKAPRIFA